MILGYLYYIVASFSNLLKGSGSHLQSQNVRLDKNNGKLCRSRGGVRVFAWGGGGGNGKCLATAAASLESRASPEKVSGGGGGEGWGGLRHFFFSDYNNSPPPPRLSEWGRGILLSWTGMTAR